MVSIHSKRRTKMKKVINHRGWFIHHMSSIAAGEPPCEHGNPYYMNPIALKKDLEVLRDCGFTKVSSKGWEVISHPILGQISFKTGLNFRNGKEYIILRLNGKEILNYLPNQ